MKLGILTLMNICMYVKLYQDSGNMNHRVKAFETPHFEHFGQDVLNQEAHMP